MTETDTVDPVASAAADAMMAVFDRALKLFAPHRYLVVEALEAAAAVYEADREAAAQNILDQTGFAGLDIADDGVRMHIVFAHDFAKAVVEAFDDLCTARGATNYIDWETTVLDPATRDAIEAGADDIPPHRRYRFIVVRPGKKSPHELRVDADVACQEAINARIQAEAQLAAVIALAERERGGVLDPRDVLTAAGQRPDCTCPGGPDGRWKTDFDPDCPRHGTTQVTRGELAELLPVARDATRWAKGAWPDLSAPRNEQGPVPDGVLVNVLVNILDHLRTPGEVRDQTGG